MDSRVATIIVNYNTAILTIACVRSVVAESKRSGYPSAIVVVDNGSNADDRALLVNNLSELAQIVPLEQNHGFSLANNAGARVALQQDPRYLVLLNSDTTLCQGAITRAVELMDDPTIGAVGMRLLHAEKPAVVQYGPGRLSPLTGHVRFRDVNVPREQALSSPVEVNMVHGGAVVLRTDAFLDGRMFPSDLFMYGEDVELSLRMRRAGWKLYYHPGSEVLHWGGASSGGYMSPFSLYHSTLSQWRIMRRNLPRVVYLVYAAYRYLWFLPAFTTYCILFRRHLVRPFLAAYRDHLRGRLNTPLPLPLSMLR